MYESQQKPPKLMKVEDYNWWENRFEGWVKAFAPESWLKLTNGYIEPVKEGGELIDPKDFTDIDIKNIVAEYKMITLIKQSVREDIISLLEQEKTSKSLWEALGKKCVGSYDWSQVCPEKDVVGYAFGADADPDRWWKADYARQATFNTRRLSDKEYLPDLEKKIREVCEASLPKVVELKKRKEEELKKMIEEVKAVAKIAAEKDQKAEEEQKDGKEEKKEEVQKAETEESVLKETEVLIGTKDCENQNRSSLVLGEEEEVAGPWFG
ncbi:uncharacterized protein LOC118484995 [Helianthus annuus]|uniref:uncharacterized protein LOC118484995 n=1 Tax=Helianthus annuus TaxID=4232 RepID=UPI001652FF95|nr:uncharacterized protein LOC118484995 [Helianthus annuus]